MTDRIGRPDIDSIANAETFLDRYWLKAELVAFCKRRGIGYAGSKAEITDRIAHYLKTGERTPPRRTRRARRARRARATSAFDWAKAYITPETVITDSYRNGPNVRAFFVSQIGPRFRFNIAFMEWMRGNCGKTMGDAVASWRRIDALRKQGVRSEIPSGNQFNRYVRDFFDANPGRTMDEARACWKAKRSRPGPNRYDDSDLDFLGSG